MSIGFGVGIQRLGSFGVATKAALLALPSPGANVRPTGFVYADSTVENNGIYTWTGAVWSRSRGLLEQMASLTITGGTANAITATAQDGVDLSQIVVALLVPSLTNTGAVTLNGRAVTDAAGSALVAGALAAGKCYMLWDDGTKYRAVFNTFVSIADVAGLTAALATKADQTTTYTKTEANALLSAKADAAAMSTALGTKADATATSNSLASKLNLDGTVQMTGRLLGVTAGMSMSADGGATQGSFCARASGAGDANVAGMTFYNDSYAIKMGVRNDGVFGIGGWSRTAWSWYTDTSGNMVTGGNVTAYSDPRLKDNVERIAGALDIVKALDGVRFNWNHKTKLIGSPGKRDIGVLADQVEAVLPELITLSIEDEDNGGERWQTVDYSKIVPVLIEAIKELSAKVERLERGQ